MQLVLLIVIHPSPKAFGGSRGSASKCTWLSFNGLVLLGLSQLRGHVNRKCCVLCTRQRPGRNACWALCKSSDDTRIKPSIAVSFQGNWMEASVKDILLGPLCLCICLKCTGMAWFVKGDMARSYHMYK